MFCETLCYGFTELAIVIGLVPRKSWLWILLCFFEKLVEIGFLGEVVVDGFEFLLCGTVLLLFGRRLGWHRSAI